MQHFVVTNYNFDIDTRLYIVISIPKDRVDPHAKLLEILGPWYPVFVYNTYDEAETRCKEMNVILSEKGEIV